MKHQRDADLNDPEQRFEWAFEAIPMNGTPTALPGPTKKEWSKHLSEAGFLHIDQVMDALVGHVSMDLLVEKLPQQKIHYQPPVRGQEHSMNISGKWVPVSEPLNLPAVPTVDLMTPQERAKMIQELKEGGHLD